MTPNPDRTEYLAAVAAALAALTRPAAPWLIACGVLAYLTLAAAFIVLAVITGDLI